MTTPNIRRGFVAVQVTLTSPNTNYNLLDLINAVIAAETKWDGVATCPGSCRELTLQSHPGIDTVGGNTKDILLGDGLLSTTRFGYVLATGDAYSDRSPMGNVDLGSIYVRSAGTAQKLNVQVKAV